MGGKTKGDKDLEW